MHKEEKIMLVKETTLDWMRKTEFWKEGLSKKEIYRAAKIMVEFQEMANIFPLSVVQKRDQMINGGWYKPIKRDLS